jgi:glycine cleavage system H protein
LFSLNHLWISSHDGKNIRLGLSQQAVEKMGICVYIEFVKQTTLKKGELFAVIESTKAATDIEAIIDLEKVRYHEELSQHPEWIFEDPLNKGWLLEAQVSDFKDLECLISYDQYLKINK